MGGLGCFIYFQECFELLCSNGDVPESPVPPNCAPIFEEWAEQKVDLIVASSYGYQWCIVDLAAKYPDTVFYGINQQLTPSKLRCNVFSGFSFSADCINAMCIRHTLMVLNPQ